MGVELNIDAEVVKRVRRLAASESDALAVTTALQEWLNSHDDTQGRASSGRLDERTDHHMSPDEFERLSTELRGRTRLVPQTPSELLLAEARRER